MSKKESAAKAKRWNVVWKDVNELTPYEKNARKNDATVPYLVNSIKRFGFRVPLVIDAKGVVVCGHTRLKAALNLGYAEVPCVVADDLTDAEIKAFRLADNKIAELSGWDFDLLDEELSELKIDFDEDMADFGFGEIADGMNPDDFFGDKEGTHGETDADAVPDAPKKPVSRRGEVYQCGEHRLMCGDSTSAADVTRLMDGEKADMVFTDPPYGVAIGDKNAMLNSVQKAGRCVENIEGDTMSTTELYETLKAAFVNVRENCKDDASYFVASPQVGSLGLMMMMMRDAGLEVRHVLMWRKNSATFSLGRLDYDYQHEPIFYTWTKRHHNYRNGKYRTTIWDFDKPRHCDLHPTMKPVALVENAILDGTEHDMIVLDAFGGSGTTMIAAESLGRKARLMELDAHYCDVIRKRWAEFVHDEGCDWEQLTPKLDGTPSNPDTSSEACSRATRRHEPSSLH